MAQIPYSPVPTAAPSGQGIGTVSVRASGDAFGSGIADATEKLGRQGERSADEIFTRAIQLQTQYNDAEAKEADAQYIIRSSNLHADFNELKGKAAKDARPKFLEDLSALREDIRGSMSNDASRKIYDGTTRQNFARTVFASTAYATKELKNYYRDTGEAVYSASKAQTDAYPNDPALFDDNAQKMVNAARDNAISLGKPPEAVANAQKDAWAEAKATQLLSVARKDPIRAGEMLADLPPGTLRGQQEKVERSLTEGKRASYAKIFSNEVTFGMDVEEGKVATGDLIQDATAKAAKLIKQDPLLEEAIRNQVISDVIKLKGLDKEVRIDNQMGMESLIGGYGSPNGEKLTSLTQVLSNPNGQAMWDKLNPKQKRMFEGQLKLNANVQKRDTTQSEYFRLNALAENDPQAFINESIGSNEKLSDADQRKFFQLQQKKRAEPEKDPRIQAAMRNLRPMLSAAGIDPSRKEDYLQFQGALQDQMADYAQQHKKQMPYDEVQLTGARLLQDQRLGSDDRWLGRGTFLPNSKVPVYSISVPDKERQAILKAYESKNGITPDDETIRRDYARKIYNERYGKKASTPDDPNRPQPPKPQ